jgi:prepilin-type N-terminal cleavage/methylation domain-containing protein
MTGYVRSNSESESGFSIVELLVVCVIIAIVAGIAIMQRGRANIDLARQNLSHDLKAALERARFDSVKRRADDSAVEATVIVNSFGYTLRTDKNQDGALDSTDDESTSINNGMIITGENGINLPVTLTYDQRGEVTATSGGSVINPVFRICYLNCLDVTKTDLLLVSPTGTVNLLPGSSDLPVFLPPSGISTVPPGTSVSNSAVVPTP